MKSAKWLISFLMVMIALLIVLRHKVGTVATTTSEPPATKASAEANSTPVTVTVTDEADSIAKTDPALNPIPQTQFHGELANGNHLQVMVQDDTGQPIKGASVKTSFRTAEQRPALTNLNRTITTSRYGTADVLWPKQKFDRLELLTTKDEYAPRQMVWDLSAGDRSRPVIR